MAKYGILTTENKKIPKILTPNAKFPKIEDTIHCYVFEDSKLFHKAWELVQGSHADLTQVIQSELQAKTARQAYPIKELSEFKHVLTTLQAQTKPILKERRDWFENLKDLVREHDFKFYGYHSHYFTNIEVNNKLYPVNAWEKQELNDMRNKESLYEKNVTSVFQLKEHLDQFPNHNKIVLATPRGYEIMRNAHFEVVKKTEDPDKFQLTGENTKEEDEELVVLITSEEWEDTNE